MSDSSFILRQKTKVNNHLDGATSLKIFLMTRNYPNKPQLILIIVLGITVFYFSANINKNLSNSSFADHTGKLKHLGGGPRASNWKDANTTYEESPLASDDHGSDVAENEEADAEVNGKDEEDSNIVSLTQEPEADVAKEEAVTVAYAASFIKCENAASSGLIDASLVLRHSIHKISSRNPESGSKYDYKMYAIVHRTQAIECLDTIQDLGYEVIIVDPPFEVEDIQCEEVRVNMHFAWCCGHHEFIKLYAFNLTEEIFVHVDLDFSFHKPMDHLFDAILYEKDSPEGQEARGKLELQFPEEQVLPDQIQSFITRDWGQVSPNRGWQSGYQAGFMVGRRDPSIIQDVTNTVLTHEYAGGYSAETGWGRKGYAEFIVGARAMQGVMAYFYDEIRPNTAVELNACRFNHLGMDMRYNEGGPWFESNEQEGNCRDGRENCEQCKFTPAEDIYSIHFSPCGKPWKCVADEKLHKQREIDVNHCFELQRLWHALRTDFENELLTKTGDNSVKKLSQGEYKTDTFLGHCRNETDYISLLEFSDDVVQISSDLYNSTLAK